MTANVDALKQSVQVLQNTENKIKAENIRMTIELEKKKKEAEQARSLKAECERLREQV